MDPEFYHIYLSVRSGVAAKDIEKKMNLALDWYRYDSKNWIVYSSVDAANWYVRLQPLAQSGGHVLICMLDTSDRAGWMPKAFWAWLKKDR